MTIHEPTTREAHATALASLYESLATTTAGIQFAADHWYSHTEKKTAKLQRKAAVLRDLIAWHKECYEQCPSCDDAEAIA